MGYADNRKIIDRGKKGCGEPFDVSVIILTYHPSWMKLCGTLLSAIRQEGLSIEILLSDDGSADNCQEKAKDFLSSQSFENIQYLPWEKNEGTVANLRKALEKAQGRYTYTISPGDYFYDTNTLRLLTDFCDERNAEICFGEAVYYSRKEDGTITLPPDRLQAPSRSGLYRFTNRHWQKTAFMFLDYILGAAYFYRTDILREYIDRIRNLVRYAEDTPSTLFALADGISVRFFPRPVVWYECGTGISDGDNGKWRQILKNEYCCTYNALKEAYPKDSVVRAAWRYKVQKEEKEPVWKQALVAPFTVWIFYCQRIFRQKKNYSTKEYYEKLNIFFSELSALF